MINKKQLRSFGLIWAFIFFLIGFYPYFKGEELRIWSIYVSGGFLVLSLTFPQIYEKTYFYQAWIKFGDVVGKVNSKIIIFLLFYVIFLPIGILLKIFRKDLLGKRIDESADSYFIDREKQPEAMENQF